jgi:hypothetical protein
MFVDLARFADLGISAQIYGPNCFRQQWVETSSQPTQRSSEIGMSVPFTIVLGAAEIAAGLGVATGVLTQVAAMGAHRDHAGRDRKEDLCLAHRVLGK